MKRIALAAVAIAVVIAAAVYFFNFRKSDGLSVLNPALGEYITSYTSGVLTSGSSFRIVLAQDAIDTVSFGETAEKLFSFDPAIQGTTTWLDRRTIEFRPSARLKSGETYLVVFKLGKVITVDPAFTEFRYAVKVIPQAIEISKGAVKPYDRKDLRRVKLEGTITTADFAEAASVEKIMTASQDGNMLHVAWAHSNGGTEHTFTVSEISRKEKASSVSLKVNGSSLGLANDETIAVEVPALGDFKVLDMRVEQGASQVIILQFSDPLNEKQNLQGFFSIPDVASLDFEIRENEVRIYPASRQKGAKTLTMEAGIRNVLDFRMKEGASFDLRFEELSPSVRFIGKGSILPSTDGMVLPFEAVSLKAVDVQIIKIFGQNVLQFLQVNQLDGSEELHRVGRPLVKRKVALTNAGVSDLGKWNRFTLDLAEFIKTEPGAVYQVRIGFRKSYAILTCPETEETIETAEIESENWDEDREFSYWDSYDDYYYGEDYEWEERDNPCHSSYYTGQRTIRKNILASDLGLIAKRGGDGKTWVVATDLLTAKPQEGVVIDLFNFQEVKIGSGTTNSEGRVEITTEQAPFALVASHGTQRGYLRMANGESLSLSEFDVGGELVQRGVKGMLYGERGVWRPGDSLYLTFLLEDKLKLLPANHPVVLELENPQGQIVQRLVRSSGDHGFYRFATATAPDAPTGNWSAHVKVGGTTFNQFLRIETVKPNRLKIKLDFGKDKLTAEENGIAGNLTVNWLHGAPGANLKAEFEVLLVDGETHFEKYPDYEFEDPAKSTEPETQSIFEGFTDAQGHADVNATIDLETNPPGVMHAIFRGKVFEESGNFSTDRFTIPYYPYTSFTGIRLPKGDAARGMLLTDTTHRVDIVSVDANGKPVSRSGIEVKLYKLNWRWWWDSNGGNAQYEYGENAQLISSRKINTENGKGQWSFRVNHPEWGRFLIRAVDPVSGHSAAKVVYLDWPGWAGRARDGAKGATMLSFSSDKPKYNTGEKVQIVFPGAKDGRALITIENGSRIVQSAWIPTVAGDNRFEFTASPEMTPTVYASVSLIQPRAQTSNDMPVRLYGVIPVQVEDAVTHLIPQIKMPAVLEPGKEVEVTVSEKSGRPMTYTLAVVDEGLLDLTRFKTPEAWPKFYAREALGVKTWDLYDDVIGAFGGKVERLLAIGGDMLAASKEDDAKSNRFKPVVKFFGPITTTGKPVVTKFIMPSYIGSVRTMVVAGYEGAYGSAEVATPVRKPLMVLATLPRVLGPDEQVKLPVTLFSMDKAIKSVNVEVKVKGPVRVKEATARNVSMDKDNLTLDFDLSVQSAIGVATIEVTATSGNFKATDVINIEVRNANPPVTQVQEFLLDAGKSWTGKVVPIGIASTNTGSFEASVLPPINLGQRLRYLLQYPYGCIEQTTSTAFPQLYLSSVRSLSENEKATIQRNIRAAIDRIRTFANRDGGFNYWPGSGDTDSWSTSYAGHFLLEAESLGYFIPDPLLKNWKRYQRARATEWRRSREYPSAEVIQAYRLYTLALAGEPDLASMNRMRELSGLSTTSVWLLAAAYAQCGQAEAATNITRNIPTMVKPYSEMGYTYGSEVRDHAIIVETLLLLNERTKAFEVLRGICEQLSNQNYWMSTQTVAWSLKAFSKYASGQKGGPIKIKHVLSGKETNLVTDQPMAQVPLVFTGTEPIQATVTNQSEAPLYMRIIIEGTPARGEEQAAASNLGISVAYEDTDGNAVDPARMVQGKQFVAAVTVTNPGLRGYYQNLALAQIFPSGWEINNLRLDDAQSAIKSDAPNYQDIRDDRVYTYFDLGPTQKKVFRVLLTATYAGQFYLPAFNCEAMYDKSIYARTRGTPAEVIKPAVP